MAILCTPLRPASNASRLYFSSGLEIVKRIQRQIYQKSIDNAGGFGICTKSFSEALHCILTNKTGVLYTPRPNLV